MEIAHLPTHAALHASSASRHSVAVKPTLCTREARQRRHATPRRPASAPPNPGDIHMSRNTLTARLALACSLAASAGADSIISITDNFWSVNGRPI
jgi:hypothetical protein